MLARLWWKEWRAFGPVLLILGLAAAVLQWFLLSLRTEDVRFGALTTAALVWAVLYAFAVGSAAFAGERESRTLGFLDALPVARPTLWLGKASFALVSTFGLALLLAGLAASGTATRNPVGPYGYGPLARMFGTILFEAVAWGFLWSSFSKNPLLAGAMSVVTVAVISIYSNLFIPTRNLATSTNLVDPEAVPARLLLASTALAASAVLVGFQQWPRWLSISPPTSAVRGRRERSTIRRASAARSLDWQAWREGRTTAALVAILGLGVPVAARVMDVSRGGPLDLILAVLAAMVAGVAVFGPEGGSATPRFLVQHGVSPGTVWGRRLWVWGLSMGAFLAIFLVGFARFGTILPPGEASGLTRLGYEIIVVAAILGDAFAVGIVCGMAIPRRITAVLVGAIGMLAIVPVQVGLATMGMVPAWALLLTPAILIGVSRAWAGDWLMGREGARPWVRLGLLLVIPFVLLGSTYVGCRAWGVPDVGPQFDPAGVRVGVVAPGRDAVEEYRRAIAELRPAPTDIEGLPASADLADPGDTVIVRGWDPEQSRVVSFWSQNRAAIDRARRASAMPASRFEDVGQLSIESPRGGPVRDVRRLARLLALDTRERMSRGDLPGAWEDILAQFRMANQLTATTPTLMQMLVACKIHHRAVGLAIDWASDPRQTAETIRAARDDLKRLPPLPSMAGALRVESLILDRTFDLSAEDLGTYLGSGSGIDIATGGLIFTHLIAPWWERARARRISRGLVAEMLPEVEREPWERSALANFDAVPKGSRLARLVFPAFSHAVYTLDRETVGRRALEQVLAIRSWQLAHGGEYPGTLEALVPVELDRLPLDPYSGKPFGFVRSEGQPAAPPILAEIPARSRFMPGTDRLPTRTGQPILYSIGPDRVDDTRKERVEVRLKGIGDILFPLP